MEQFNDTPVVNGTAYPTVTLEPASYRLRILNAANDRFWNLQWYVAEQIEEEHLARTLNDKLELVGDDKSGIYLFDRDIMMHRNATGGGK